MNKPKIVISSGVNQDIDNYINAVTQYGAEVIVVSPNEMNIIEDLKFESFYESDPYYGKVFLKN